jgi:hypothetical protein
MSIRSLAETGHVVPRPSRDTAVQRRGSQRKRGPRLLQRRWSARLSDSFDEHILRMNRERLEVLRVGGQNSSTRLGDRDNKGIDRRSSPSKTSKQRRTAGHRFRDCLRHVAGLQKPIFICIAARVSSETFDKDDGWYFRRPQPLLTKRQNQCQAISGAFCQRVTPPESRTSTETYPSLR